MKLKIVIIASFIGSLAFSQVGIGTPNPQQQLHVSGTSSSSTIGTSTIRLVKPTVRVDGLNNTNQGSTDFLRGVSSNQNGDLVAVSATPKKLFMYDPIGIGVDGTDYLNQTTITSTSTSGAVESLLRSFSFTLTERSMVEILTSTSVRLYSSGTTVITDGAAKSYGTFFMFTTAPTGYQGHKFALSSEIYSNRVNQAVAAGPYYIPSSESIVLPPGSYTIGVYAYINGGSGTVANFIANYGTESNDTFSIVAYPIH